MDTFPASRMSPCRWHQAWLPYLKLHPFLLLPISLILFSIFLYFHTIYHFLNYLLKIFIVLENNFHRKRSVSALFINVSGVFQIVSSASSIFSDWMYACTHEWMNDCMSKWCDKVKNASTIAFSCARSPLFVPLLWTLCLYTSHAIHGTSISTFEKWNE